MGSRRSFGLMAAMIIGSLCFTAGLEVPLRKKIGRMERFDFQIENLNQSINGNKALETDFIPILTNREPVVMNRKPILSDGLNNSTFHAKSYHSFDNPMESESLTRNSIIADLDKHGPSEYEAYPPDFFRPGIAEGKIKPRVFVTHKSRRINLPIYTTIYSEHKVISHGHAPHKRPHRGGRRGRRRKNRRKKRPRHHHGNHALPSYAPAFISYGPIYGPPPDSKSVINLNPVHDHAHHSWQQGSHTQNHPTFQYHKPGEIVQNPIFPQHPKDSHKDLFGYFGSDNTRSQQYSQPNNFPTRDNQWASPSYNNYHKPSSNPPIYLPQVTRPLSGADYPSPAEYPVANHQNFGGYSVNPPNYSQKYMRDLRDYKGSQASYSNSNNYPITNNNKYLSGTTTGGYGKSSYGSPHQPQPYDMPMHFGHPMHNFGPPKSSFGQPPPTYGPEVTYNGHEFEQTTKTPSLNFPKDPYTTRDDPYSKREDPYRKRDDPYTTREERRKPYKSSSSDYISAPDRERFQSEEPEIYRRKKKPRVNYFDEKEQNYLNSNNNLYRDDHKSYKATTMKYIEGPSGPSHSRDSPRDTIHYHKKGKYGKSKGRFPNFYDEPYRDERGSLDSESYERPAIKYPKYSHSKYDGQLRMEKFKEKDVISGPSSTIDSSYKSSIKYQKGRPPPEYDTNYNSPGLSLDPKGVDWMPWEKDKPRSQIVASSYPSNVLRKPLKYTTLPYSMEDHMPDPGHTKLPKLTYSLQKMGKTPEYLYENIEESKLKPRIKPPDSPMITIENHDNESRIVENKKKEKRGEENEVTKTPLAVSLPQVFLDKQMSRKILLELESKRHRKRAKKISSA